MSENAIAIIDQGIDATYKNLSKMHVEEIVVVGEDSEKNGHKHEATAHGTNIFNIIATNTSGYKLVSVKLSSEGALYPDLLRQALDVLAEQPMIRIINISLGFFAQQYPLALLKSLQKCHDRGMIIVAATHPKPYVECYPAKAPFVFGVGIALTQAINEFHYLGDGYVNVLAKGVHQRLSNGEHGYLIRGGTSYAAAAFTANVANILQHDTEMTYADVVSILKQRSVPLRAAQHLGQVFHKSLTNYSRFLTQDDKVLLFATDDPELKKIYKEITGVVTLVIRYPINPANCFDMDVGQGIREIDGILSPRIAEYAKTVVLGNFLLNPHLINIYFAYSLIDLCVKLNFNFVCLDSYIREIVILATRSAEGQFKGKVF
ncbi:MAG: S8 family serine peptidase [Cyclobacteriaceae bacterium]|nr:S8 family serine peptidase [Cyclobacteriaceae bacterium]